MRTHGPMALVSLALALALLLTPGIAVGQGEPVADSPLADAITLPWEDGTYLVGVGMEGGSGKASIASPAEVTVTDGKAVARIEWSSPNYDYMVVLGKTYLPINTEGNSVFEIPLLALDEPFAVVGDTTAMSKPHEVEYLLTFDSASAMAADGIASGSGLPLPMLATCMAAAGAGVAILLVRKRGHAGA